MECALKACIAKQMKAEEFPDKAFAEKCWTHDFERLLVLAGLKANRDEAAAADPDRANNWFAIKNWNESKRYTWVTQTKALELYNAITNKKHGVLPWIKLFW